MSVFVAAIATDSGVPLFSRKRGTCEGMQFSTVASLHGVNMFSKCHDVAILETELQNGSMKWKEFNKSITLLGVVTGGLQCELDLLLSSVYDAMVLTVGRPHLETFKSTEQVKRDLRPGLFLVDSLLESVDPATVSGTQPTMLLDLMECLLCSEAAQLQRTLEQYCEQVSGRYACLVIHGRLAASSADWGELDPREARLLLLMGSQAGAPLRETCVYLPYTSPSVAFRAVTCKLLSDVFVQVVCGATPALSQVDSTVLRVWEHAAHLLRDAKRTYPRNLPDSLQLEPEVLGILLVNMAARKCVSRRGVHSRSRHQTQSSSTHRLHILRMFYVRTARHLGSHSPGDQEDEWETRLRECSTEGYWSSGYHTCHASRSQHLLCCALYSSAVPLHTARMITNQILTAALSNKDLIW